MVLRDQRENVKKITRNELADRSGVSASNIRAIEEGRTLEPGVFTVAAIAIALELDVSDVLRTRTGRLKTRRLGEVQASPDNA